MSNQIRPLDENALSHAIAMMPWPTRDIAPNLREFAAQLWLQFCSAPVADDGEWLPVTQSPPMKTGELGWLSSDPLLSFGLDGKFRVVTLELVDPDSTPTWFSHCSERWNLNGVISQWKVIKPPQ